MSRFFHDNSLVDWDVLVAASQSELHLDRKEALQQARVRATNYLKGLGIDVSGGAATAAMKAAVERGFVERGLLDQALRALKVRNWLTYHRPNEVKASDVRDAVEALRAVCEGEVAHDQREARTDAQVLEDLTTELRRSCDQALIGLAVVAAGLAAAPSVFGALSKVASAWGEGADAMAKVLFGGLAVVAGVVVVCVGIWAWGRQGEASAPTPAAAVVVAPALESARPEDEQCAFANECIEHGFQDSSGLCVAESSMKLRLRNRCSFPVATEICFARGGSKAKCSVIDLEAGAAVSRSACGTCGMARVRALKGSPSSGCRKRMADDAERVPCK